MRRWSLVCAGVLAACSSKPADSVPAADVAVPAEPVLLLSHEAWTATDPATTAFPPPAGERCPEAGYAAESGFFEVETDVCAWGTFTQTLPRALAAGDTLQVVVWHLDLWAPEPTTARLVLALGEDIAWEGVFDVPSDEFVEEVSVELAAAVPDQSTATFLVANHGLNSYRLGDVFVETVSP